MGSDLGRGSLPLLSHPALAMDPIPLGGWREHPGSKSILPCCTAVAMDAWGK